VPYLLIEGLGKPTVRIVLVVAVLAAGLGLRFAVIAWGLPVAAGLAAGAIIFMRLLQKEAPPSSARRRTGGAPGAAAGHAALGSARARTWCRPARPVRAVISWPAKARPVPAVRGIVGHGAHQPPEPAAHRRVLGFTGPRAFQATFQVIILWLDILLVGALASSYAAGVYSAVSKLAIIAPSRLRATGWPSAPG